MVQVFGRIVTTWLSSSASLLPPPKPRCNSMRQAGFEPTTFGSGASWLAAASGGQHGFKGVSAGQRRQPTPPLQLKSQLFARWVGRAPSLRRREIVARTPKPTRTAPHGPDAAQSNAMGEVSAPRFKGRQG